MYEALDDTQALVICTEWHEFRRPDWSEIDSRLANPVIFDGRNLYKPSRMEEMGYEYYSIGRPHILAPVAQ
jgi:UDPglucose 6-dehydrogenase